jgi:hypothetical protein
MTRKAPFKSPVASGTLQTWGLVPPPPLLLLLLLLPFLHYFLIELNILAS